MVERQDAYKIGINVPKFIEILKENDFEYNPYINAVFSEKLSGPCLGKLLRAVESYIIISKDSSKDKELERTEKERLGKLLESL